MKTTFLIRFALFAALACGPLALIAAMLILPLLDTHSSAPSLTVNQILEDTTRQSIAAIKTAADMYEIRTGKYPDSISALIPASCASVAYFAKDAWGNDFQIRKTDKGVEIRSAGPDGSFNSADDITN